MRTTPGVVRTVAGYTGGSVTAPPTYESVSNGDGHSEAVRVYYDGASTSFAQLLHVFFTSHEPRWPVRRKARSVIWWHSEEQRIEAEAALASRESELGRTVHTAIEPAGAWFDAEEWQQQYLFKQQQADQ